LHNPAHDLWVRAGIDGGQSEAAQVRQLRAAGDNKVFREVASGAKTDRPREYPTALYAMIMTVREELSQTGDQRLPHVLDADIMVKPKRR